MAIYGIGASYDRDVSGEFIINQVACIGWAKSDAPALHEILRYIKIGDIIYIKSAPIGQGLRVKGVGLVVDNQIKTIAKLGEGIGVKWVWSGHENLGSIDDKYNVRNNTIYEEFNNTVQMKVIELLLKK